jgi:broad specificity phosphatase PhoE
VLDPDLREIGCGAADGRSVHEVRASYPEHWGRNERQDDDDFRWPGGESYREFRERCLRAVRRIAARHPGACVAVFTHTGVVTQLIGAIRGFPAARWSAYRPKNGSITVIDWDGPAGRLVSFDECSYVADDAGDADHARGRARTR